MHYVTTRNMVIYLVYNYLPSKEMCSKDNEYYNDSKVQFFPLINTDSYLSVLQISGITRRECAQ